MSITEKEFQKFRENELGPEDTFQFECAMCGSCCRKRREPITVTGADAFRIAQELGASPVEVLAKYTVGYVGDTSHLPIHVLRERMDGSCSLLRKGRCTVQKNKPAVCALFPLGRYYDGRDNRFHYFVNQMCSNGKTGKTIWKLNEWLDSFQIRDTEKMTLAWDSLMISLATVTVKLDKRKINGRLLEILCGVLYLNYDTSMPYIPQVEANTEFAKSVLKKEFNIRI